MLKQILLIPLLLISFCGNTHAQLADADHYLDSVKLVLQKKWPNNPTVNIVFHGHSVPSGYYNTPIVKTLEAYPQRTLVGVKEKYPYAVVNVIVTAIGGENSEQGARRFTSDVLTHKPTVLCIDYSLNDRAIGLERARKAWGKMVEAALKQKIPVILLTPTPDTNENILDENTPLAQHARQVRALAVKYQVGLVDSYAKFQEMAQRQEDMKKYMSQNNHPNTLGHRVVAEEVLRWFAAN